MQYTSKVLIAALDWGLGHASRMIPLIRHFQQKNYEVVLASSSTALDLWRTTFPELQFEDLPSYQVNYQSESMLANMLAQSPKLINAIKKEHAQCQQIVLDHSPNLIISDNRYGIWHKDVPSVFITHQLQILPPKSIAFSKQALRQMHQFMMRNFDQIWVPDFAGEQNLAGIMSHTDRVLNKLHYIGPLSRFAECQFPILEFTHDKKSLPTILAMISGPEPTRTCFEEILLKQLESYKGKSIVLQGLPANYREQIIGNCTIYNHLPDSQLLALLPEIDLVIARSGYSTIMDLIFWQKKAVFVPTPGQTEQLYLAQKLVGEGQFYSQQQMDFDLQDCLAHYEEYSGFVAMERPTFELMESALQLLLNDFNG